MTGSAKLANPAAEAAGKIVVVRAELRDTSLVGRTEAADGSTVMFGFASKKNGEDNRGLRSYDSLLSEASEKACMITLTEFIPGRSAKVRLQGCVLGRSFEQVNGPINDKTVTLKDVTLSCDAWYSYL